MACGFCPFARMFSPVCKGVFTVITGKDSKNTAWPARCRRFFLCFRPLFGENAVGAVWQCSLSVPFFFFSSLRFFSWAQSFVFSDCLTLVRPCPPASVFCKWRLVNSIVGPVAAAFRAKRVKFTPFADPIKKKRRKFVEATPKKYYICTRGALKSTQNLKIR